MTLTPDAPNRYQLADLTVDLKRRQVVRGKSVIALPKLSFRLLVALIESAPGVLLHDELLDAVWPGRIVGSETVTQRVKLVRQALGDDANAPRYIGLVRGQGYRLLTPVEPLPDETTDIGGSLFAELGRRRVIQVALIYAAIAWSITEVLTFLISALPVFPDWSTMLVAIVFMAGFPVAMFLAWRFDVRPGGIQRTHATSTQGRLTIVAALLLLVGATAVLFQIIYPAVVDRESGSSLAGGHSIVGETTIAVLPFVNASNDLDDLYMSEGLGDELRDQLGQINDLRVAARSSSVVFRDQIVDAITIAETLGVRKLVEGTVRRENDQLRVTINIVDGATGFRDWTGTFDRAVGNLLAIQQEIARTVVGQILPELDQDLVANALPSLDASAYEIMVLARHLYQQVKDSPVVDIGEMIRVIELYEQAIDLDPQSAIAHSRLGESYLYIGDFETAEDPIFRALSLNPELSEVQNTLGLYYWSRYLPGSGEAHRKAIELNPNNADAQEKYAKWLWHQQVTDEVEEYFQRALNLDPASLSRYLDLGHFYGISNRRDQARAIIQRVEESFSGANASMALARLNEITGDLDEAIGWALRANEQAPENPLTTWQVAELYARIGDFSAARPFQHPESPFDVLYWDREYEEMILLGEDLVFEPPVEIQIWYGLGRAYVATGRYDQAIFALQRQGLPENVFVDSRRANGLEALVSLADALNQAGETERAIEYAVWLADAFSRLSETGAGDSWWPNLYESCALSILGKDQEALETLERVNRSIGLLWYPVLRDAPCFRKYHGNPAYEDVVTNYEMRLTDLRARLPETLKRMNVLP